ncbi:MAG TPA: guanylate kinase [Gemmatimonadaceae bacterium]|nr:guanylate kinase [Gemmatimonadaceae bacterium]
MNPFPIILSSPSGGGKTTIRKEVLTLRPDVGYSVSATTRRPRAAEVDGRDYYFLTNGEFEASRDRGEFAESAEVHGKLYGTLRREVDRVLQGGRHVIMDIDVQGAAQFVQSYPASVLIFLLPPSADVLLTRLVARKTEDRSDLVVRLKDARRELMAVGQYQYVVVNGDLARAVRDVSAIIDAESTRPSRVATLDEHVHGLIDGLENEITRLGGV